MIKLFSMLLMSLFVFGLCAKLAYPLPSSATLRGVTGTAVILEEISDSASADGLSKEGLRQFVENRLRDADINVLEERKWFNVFGGSYLYIKVIASKSESENYYAVYIDIDLNRAIVIMGTKLGESISTTGSTWSVGKLFSCSPEVLNECVGKALGELVDLFIEDYKVVNKPK